LLAAVVAVAVVALDTLEEAAADMLTVYLL
jgi:hypothetical protein